MMDETQKQEMLQAALSEAIKHNDELVADLCRKSLAGDDRAWEEVWHILQERDDIRHEIMRYEMGSDY